MKGQEARTSEGLPLTAWWDFLRARGGVTPSGWAPAFFGLYGEARLRPNGVPFFRFKGYEKILGCEKVKKTFWFGDLFIFIYLQCIFSSY